MTEVFEPLGEDRWYSATLRLFGDSLDLEDAREQLPSASVQLSRKGDHIQNNPRFAKNRTNICLVSFGKSSAEPWEPRLLRLLETAEPISGWLAPVQVAVLNITDAQSDYCREIAEKLEKALPQHPLRVALDLRNEKITYKIREHSMQKLPFILVAGDKERAAGAVAVRARGNKDLGVMPVDAFIELITQAIASKT